jgi:lipopolysaccharide export LptBFGC system permease protein LptF
MDINELRKAFTAAKGESRYEFAVEMYKKISVPFSIVAFVLLTVPLGIKRRTEGKFSGVVYSLLIFICYYILSAIMENIGRVYEAPPVLVCFAPNVLFSAAGLYLITQLNNEDQARILDRFKRLWEPSLAKAE